MSKTAARLALGFALVGLAASAAAAYAHSRLLRDPSYVSFCDVSLLVSCTQVYASRFSMVGGISVAVFGTLWFAGATLLAGAGLIGPSSVRENVAANAAVSAFFAEAHPTNVGSTGQRSFATDTRGTIFFDNTGATFAAPIDPAASVLQ